MLHTLVLDEEGMAASPGAAPAPEAVAYRAPATLDVERVRAELPRPGQTLQEAHDGTVGSAADSVPPPHANDPAGSPSSIALAVLRDALAAERQRTKDLRNSLDALQVTLAIERERAEQLSRERDLWARRGQLLATALGQEASVVGTSAEPAMASVPLFEGPRSQAA